MIKFIALFGLWLTHCFGRAIVDSIFRRSFCRLCIDWWSRWFLFTPISLLLWLLPRFNALGLVIPRC